MIATETVSITVSVAAIIAAVGGTTTALYQIRRQPTASENHDIACKALKMAEDADQKSNELQTELAKCNKLHEQCQRRVSRLEANVSYLKRRTNHD